MTDRANLTDVVIAGDSLTGHLLAIALLRAGGPSLTVRLVGRTKGQRPESADIRAFAISAASRNVLVALGIWPLVAEAAQPVTAIDITDGRLDSPVRPVFVHYDNVLAPDEPASFILEARHLRAAVAEVLGWMPGLTAPLAGPVQSIALSEPGIVLELAEGTVTARLAVAAEGRDSPLRGLAGIKTVDWSYPQAAIVTAVRHERSHGGKAVQHFLPAGPFAILPLHGGFRSSLVWSEMRSEAERILALDDEAFDAELGQRFGGILGEVHAEGPRVTWPLEMQLARRFVGERLALIGDAARTVHPIAGQGLNIGLRDVAALAEIIVDTHRLGLDVGSAEPLARYERWRRFDSVLSTMTMDGLNRLFSNDNTALRTLRDVGLGLVERSPALKGFFVREAAGLTGEVPRLMRGAVL